MAGEPDRDGVVEGVVEAVDVHELGVREVRSNLGQRIGDLGEGEDHDVVAFVAEVPQARFVRRRVEHLDERRLDPEVLFDPFEAGHHVVDRPLVASALVDEQGDPRIGVRRRLDVGGGRSGDRDNRRERCHHDKKSSEHFASQIWRHSNVRLEPPQTVDGEAPQCKPDRRYSEPP